MRLEWIGLWRNRISDLSPLAKLTNLKRLIVTETGITGEGVEKLEAALPECQIQFN